MLNYSLFWLPFASSQKLKLRELSSWLELVGMDMNFPRLSLPEAGDPLREWLSDNNIHDERVFAAMASRYMIPEELQEFKEQDIRCTLHVFLPKKSFRYQRKQSNLQGIEFRCN